MRIKPKRTSPNPFEGEGPGPRAPRPGSLPDAITFTYSAPRPIEKAKFLDDCRSQFFIFKDTWNAPYCGWHVCHFPTCGLLIFNAPSREYAVKVFENVLPHLDLHKINRVLWYGDRRPIPDHIEDYLSHVWKLDYPLAEIPTVEKWQKSGCGNSHQNVNESLSKGKLKIRRRS